MNPLTKIIIEAVAKELGHPDWLRDGNLLAEAVKGELDSMIGKQNITPYQAANDAANYIRGMILDLEAFDNALCRVPDDLDNFDTCEHCGQWVDNLTRIRVIGDPGGAESEEFVCSACFSIEAAR